MHQRIEIIRTHEAVEALLGQLEDERLEFKQQSWTEAQEAAKDIAALANRDGGQIILGVEADGEARARGFRTWCSGSDADAVQRARHQLISALRPRDFVDQLDFLPIPLESGGRVCVVVVPPSPALVAVATGGDRDPRFSFPIRTGRETRWMSYDEIADRMNSEERIAEHRLRTLLESPGQKTIALISGVWFPGYRAPAQMDSVRLALVALKPEHAEFEWTTSVYFYGGPTFTAQVQGKALSVPFGLIRRVLPREGGGAFVELRVDLLWEGVAFGFGRYGPS